MSFPGHAALPTTYLSRLSAIHRRLCPRAYLEIGVCSGRSLVLAEEAEVAVGVDPAPELTVELPANTRLFQETSDSFFGRDVGEIFGGLPLDLAFIDGMHLFEYALRDFAHSARHCGPGAVIAVHDTLPHDRVMAQRARETQAWTGDVWKLVPCLRRHLPYLEVATLDTAPTGLTLFRGMDPSDTTLIDNYDAIVADYVDLDFGHFSPAGAVTDDLDWIERHLRPRQALRSTPRCSARGDPAP